MIKKNAKHATLKPTLKESIRAAASINSIKVAAQFIKVAARSIKAAHNIKVLI